VDKAPESVAAADVASGWFCSSFVRLGRTEFGRSMRVGAEYSVSPANHPIQQDSAGGAA
jgi:hypothetical protein